MFATIYQNRAKRERTGKFTIVQIKQVAPVIKETATETIVITVYTFFF
jgi:hypothetical protein